MPLDAQIGDLVQTREKMFLEWKIKEFFSLFEKRYSSPVFSFADALWRLRLYPRETDDPEEGISTDNFGQGEDLSVEQVELYLVREDSGPRQTINYAFGIKYSDGVEENEKQQNQFSDEGHEYGEVLWLRDDLQKQASRLVPGNVLTITCRLKCSQPHIAKVSSSSRVWELSRSMETVLAEGKRADFVLKMGDREWPVHKVILENRCEYFANMFRHDWVENTVGEVTFEDIEEEALDNVLDFVYTGCVEDMSVDNVCGVYVAAHKFLLDGLKALCVEYMKGDMCLEIVCKVLVIADTYGEEDLRQSAIEYFMLEEDRIFDSEEWKELKKCHGSLAAEILEEIKKIENKNRTKKRD